MSTVELPEHKRYTPAVDLVDDPIAYAIEHDLVDDHSDAAREKIGAWRWKGVFKRRDIILPHIRGKQAIDFGGQAGSIGYGATVVDRESDLYPSLYDVLAPVDTVFSSQTLEHVPQIDCWLLAAREILKPGGTLILHVPTWHNETLRPENWPSHCHGFCLSDDEIAPSHYVRIDTLVQKYFKLDYGELFEDTNLLLIASKQ